MSTWNGLKKLLLIFTLMTCGNAFVFAQEGPRKIKASTTKKKFSQFHVGYQVWQEHIDASSAGTESEMLAHFHGAKIGYSLHHPHKNVRWVTVYGADLGIGLTKGTATSPLTDEVEDQTWFSITAYPGLMYRSTSKSELGILIPVSWRMIQWKLQDPYDLDRDSSFSAGISLVYVNRFSLKSSMTVTLTHQQMWNATIWGVGYQIDLR